MAFFLVFHMFLIAGWDKGVAWVLREAPGGNEGSALSALHGFLLHLLFLRIYLSFFGSMLSLQAEVYTAVNPITPAAIRDWKTSSLQTKVAIHNQM